MILVVPLLCEHRLCILKIKKLVSAFFTLKITPVGKFGMFRTPDIYLAG